MKIPRDKHLKKPAQSDLKREQAIDLWRKKMPLKDIRYHLGFKERTLCRILAFAKRGDPEKAIKRKEGLGQTPEFEKKLNNLVINNPCIT